jgi:quinol monooxygenase YgiN
MGMSQMRRAAGIALALVCCLSPATQSYGQEARGVSYSSIPPNAVSIVARVRAKPGKAEELRSVTLPLIAQVRSDPKNLVYFLQESREQPGHFIFYEVFATEADFEAHNAMPYVKEWFKTIEKLADGGVTVMKMTVLK